MMLRWKRIRKLRGRSDPRADAGSADWVEWPKGGPLGERSRSATRVAYTLRGGAVPPNGPSLAAVLRVVCTLREVGAVHRTARHWQLSGSRSVNRPGRL